MLVKQQRHSAAAAVLDGLVELRLQVSYVMEQDDVPKALHEHGEQFRRVWHRYVGQLDEEVAARVLPVSLVMSLSAVAAGHASKAEPATQLLYAVERAFRNAFASLDAVLNGDKLPPASFPSLPDMMRIMADPDRVGDTGEDKLRLALNDYPDGPDNARTKMMFG